MPKKEVWLSEETLNDIRKIIGIKPGEPDKGVSEFTREAVELKIDIEKYEYGVENLIEQLRQYEYVYISKKQLLEMCINAPAVVKYP